MTQTEVRKALRKEKIKARDSLSRELRIELSKTICQRILDSEVFQRAKTILLYRGVRGEVRLDALETAEEAQNKRLLFPLCISDKEMIALLPKDEEAWLSGYFGIPEPSRKDSVEVPPEEIDLVICPCTAFDKKGMRLGMGGGFYDRYIPKCTNAHIVSVAFEVQSAEEIPSEWWDCPVEMTFTEKGIHVFCDKNEEGRL